jgi:DNA-binding MarR family transcriptional regulator
MSEPHGTAPNVDLTGVDELSAEVFRAFIAVLQLHRRYMTKTLVERGAHPGQAFCLRLIGDQDGITQRDLAAELHVARPTITRMLQSLEKAGAVVRRPDEADQRLTRVRLTPAGRALLEDYRGIASGYVNQTIATLPAEDRRELARLLDELAASMRRAMSGEGDGAQ